MSLLTPVNFFAWSFDNWGGANTYPTVGGIGDTFTAKANSDLANATWVEVASAAEMAQDAYLVRFCGLFASTSGADRSGIYQLGIDPAGGTSYSAVIDNIVVSPTTTSVFTNSPFFMHRLPLFIKAGSSVAMRGATVHTVDVTGNYFAFQCFGQPSAPEAVWSGGKCETLGFTSGVTGTAVSCQAAANGRVFPSTWTSIGTTTFAWKALSAAVAVGATSGTTIAGSAYYLQIGWGSATSPIIVIPKIHIETSSLEVVYVFGPDTLTGCDIPSGQTIYARVCGDTTTPDNQGYINVTVMGVG